MRGTDPGSARAEAERLAAAALAAARLAVSGPGAARLLGAVSDTLAGLLDGPRARGGASDRSSTGAPGGVATGTAECCVCPLCRLIAALRDPRPEFVERLATGAGDLATGLVSLLRAFGASESPSAGGAGEPPRREPTGAAAGASARSADGALASEEGPTAGTPPEPPTPPPDDVWAAATRGAGRSVSGAADETARAAGAATPPPERRGDTAGTADEA
ncbi:MAG TPA: hypothetical protein VIL44_04210 [Micromonospora sp.]